VSSCRHLCGSIYLYMFSVYPYSSEATLLAPLGFKWFVWFWKCCQKKMPRQSDADGHPATSASGRSACSASLPPSGAGGEVSGHLNLTSTFTHLRGHKVLQSLPSPLVCLLNNSLLLRARQTSEKNLFLCSQCMKDVCVCAEVAETGELEGKVADFSAALGPSCSSEGKDAAISFLVCHLWRPS